MQHYDHRGSTTDISTSQSIALFEGNPLAVWIYDRESLRILEANESASSQYGYECEEFVTLLMSDMLLPDQSAAVDGARDGIQSADMIHTHVKKDGTQIQIMLRGNDLIYRGRPSRLVVAEDVTESRTAHAQLLQMAHYDPLTRLPNRTLLSDRMAQAFSAAKRLGHKTAFICIDLDHFKEINDSSGHATGDECLKYVAGLLTGRLRGMDTVSRTGGDEFTVVLGELESVASAGRVGEMLLQAFRKPAEFGGHNVQVSSSIGIAVYPDHGADVDEVWRCADTAMYRSKRAGGNRYNVATLQAGGMVDDNAAARLYVDKMFDQHKLQLHYQLQYACPGMIRGAKVFLRPPDIRAGHVSIDEFVRQVEESGVIHRPIRRWMLDQVCRQLAEWKKLVPFRTLVALNVSPVQLMLPEFSVELRSSISTWNIDPASLEIEIAENAITNYDEIGNKMREIHAMGIRFAIRGFGIGFSSLQDLFRLPISTVKIDRSFVQGLSNGGDSLLVINAIIAMAHSLKMQVIAEGVEYEGQKSILEELGCDGMQGSLFSHFLSSTELTKLLRLKPNHKQNAKRRAHQHT
jgi:diguanylate cyclase (GGDEF)-like protein/PAS domain S-box-containing protein